ncbi:MAG: uracil-DNA glycosylase [Planctomycetota bacterium]|nr:uracil-DNA glycosylase [Planctomycetota bacterium]
MDPRLHKIAKQHAETCRLLGVDFIPVYSTSLGVEEEPTTAAAVTTAPVERTAETAAMAAAPAEAIAQPVVVASGSKAAAFKAAMATSGAAASAPAAKPATARRAPAEAPAMFEERTPPPGVPGKKTDDRAASQAALDALRAQYEADAPHKPFITTYNKIVFGEGDPCARLMFIGEAPGEDEDRTGRPFVGRAGQLLEKMIVGMGLTREQVYIANVLKVRPPNNATPTSAEAAASAPYLYRQIAIVQPDAIVTLGLPASRTILNSEESMAAMRGTWRAFADTITSPTRVIPVMPTYHPAYLLRAYTPENRLKVWNDLVKVLERLGLPVPRSGAKGGGEA